MSVCAYVHMHTYLPAHSPRIHISHHVHSAVTEKKGFRLEEVLINVMQWPQRQLQYIKKVGKCLCVARRGRGSKGSKIGAQLKGCSYEGSSVL